MAGREKGASKANFAKIIYDDLQRETQPKLNMELLKKQLKWMKFSAILNAIAILAAVLLGFSLQKLKSHIFPKPSAQQSIQVQPEKVKAEFQALHPERKNDKETLQASISEKQNR